MTAAPKPDTTPNPAPTKEQVDLSHQWVIAAMIRVPPNIARAADFRGSFRLKEQTRVEALETYCEKCRRPYDEAADTVCQAKINNEHLIGGDQSERVKRKQFVKPANAVPLPAARINRLGIAAVMRGEA